MKATFFLMFVTVGLLLSGCAVVQSDQEIGETAVPAIAEEWDGIWIYNGGSVNIAVIDKDKGLFEIAWIERKDGKFAIKTSRISMLRQGDAVFANMADEKEKGKFTFARIKSNPDEIIIWLPDYAKFQQLVLANKLPGKIVEENKIQLSGLGPEHIKIIADVKHESLFSLDNPIVLKRPVKLNYQNNK